MTKPHDPKQADAQDPNLPEDVAAAKRHDSDDDARRAHKCCKGPIPVTIAARAPVDTEYGELNSLIRHQIQANSFAEYQRFMDRLAEGAPHLAYDPQAVQELGKQGERLAGLGLHKIHGVAAYEVLSLATSVWLLTRCGPMCEDFDLEAHPNAVGAFATSDAARWGISVDALKQRITDYLGSFDTAKAATPYLDLIVEQLIPSLKHMPRLNRLYKSRWECPSMIELIWSYWHEEGMQCQTMNAIALRFQNRRSRPGRDPLADLEIDPLRPLSNLLWGWLEASYKRLIQRYIYAYKAVTGVDLTLEPVNSVMPARLLQARLNRQLAPVRALRP